MKKLYNKKEYDNAKSRDLLPLQCKACQKTFHKTKNYIMQASSKHINQKCNYCSIQCLNTTKKVSKKVGCSQCKTKFYKRPSEIKKSKSGNHFCSKTCSTTYNNLNKKTGTRRSKLENWLEEQLTTIYPKLEIEYNGKSAIGSELDIYIPSLKLAFEINGIYHYEPIHGPKKLSSIQANDQNKFQQCIENEVSLCVIDASSIKYFKPERVKKYLDIITDIVNDLLAEQ
jgi:hypothetical protein